MFYKRSNKPMRLNGLAAGIAIGALAGMLSTPAFAATSARIACPEAARASLAVPFHVLGTEYVDNSSQVVSSADDDAVEMLDLASASHLLAPQAEAAIRNAFRPSIAGADTEHKAASDSEKRVETISRMNTRLPGTSDDDISRFRTQMYRRDI